MSKPWAVPMVCDNCGRTFTPGHHRQVYCTKACGTAFEARRKIRGQNVVSGLMAWRLGRNTRAAGAKVTAKEAFAEFCRLADEWNAEDKAAGRPSALKVVQHQRQMSEMGKYPAAGAQ